MPSKSFYHRIRTLNARMVMNYQRGIGPSRNVLLLTTMGRKTGLPHQTPLQYEELNGDYYIASARGPEADWFKNILANQKCRAQIREWEFESVGEPVTDPARIADFLELRLRRHPVMVRLIMWLFEGLPLHFDYADLLKICQKKAMVILRASEV